MSVFLKRHGRPVKYIQASDLALGEIVHDSGSYYMVIRQANPDEALYDKSCNGTWFVSTQPFQSHIWGSELTNYPESELKQSVEAWQGFLSSQLADAIKTIKLPYIKDFGSSAIESGANGFETKLFILSAAEISSDAPTRDGVAIPQNLKDLLFVDSTAEWTRSITSANDKNVAIAYSKYLGFYEQDDPIGQASIRPAFVLPYNARFNSETKTFQGVW